MSVVFLLVHIIYLKWSNDLSVSVLMNDNLDITFLVKSKPVKISVYKALRCLLNSELVYVIGVF